MDFSDFPGDPKGLEEFWTELEQTNPFDINVKPNDLFDLSDEALKNFMLSGNNFESPDLDIPLDDGTDAIFQIKAEPFDTPHSQLNQSWPITTTASAATMSDVAFPPSPPYDPDESCLIPNTTALQNPVVVQSANLNDIATINNLVSNPKGNLYVIPIPNHDSPGLLYKILEQEGRLHDTKVQSFSNTNGQITEQVTPPVGMSELKRKLPTSPTSLNSVDPAKKSNVLPPTTSTDGKRIVTSLPSSIPPNKIAITPLKPQSPQGAGNIANGRQKKEKKVSGHNEVERRYREKMNSQFDNLRSLVFGHGAKSAKTQTLSKAIQEIKVLRKYARALQQQNARLRVLVPSEAQNQLPPPTRSLTSFTKAWSRRNGCGSGSSDGSSDRDSDDDLDSMIEPNLSPTMKQKHSASPPVVGDKARAGLCLFMFLFMVYMPFQGTLPSVNSVNEPFHGPSRHLSSVGYDVNSVGYNVNSPAYAVGFYIVQVLVSFLMFMWLFVTSEPSLSTDPEQEISFWECINQASHHMNHENQVTANDMVEAFDKLEHALRLLNKPLPLTTLDRLCCLWWSLLCHLLNQFGISHFIHWLCKGLKWRTRSEKEIAHRQLASRMATIAYQKLHELLMTDPKRKNENLLACVASICAINSADSLSFTVGPELTCRAYLNACLHLKAQFPVLQRWFASYYHGCAHNVYRLHAEEISSSLSWAFHHDATNFILFGEWDLNHRLSPASDPAEVSDCLGLVAQQYRTSLLQSVLKAVVAPETSFPKLSRRQCLMEADNLLSMLRRSVLYRDETEGASSDTTSWWLDVITHVLDVEHTSANRKTSTIPAASETPWFKNKSWNSLVQAISTALSVHDALANGDSDLDLAALDSQLTAANENMKQCCIASDIDGHDYAELLQLMVLFCADIMLKARYRFWERSGCSKASNKDLTGFNESIGVLQRYGNTYPELKHKVRYYSTIVRIAAGANPILTTQLLRRKSCRSSYSGNPTSEDTELAKTYVATYKHLHQQAIPKTSIGSIVTTLKEAGKILEKSNENLTFKECKQLLFQYSNLSCAHM